MPTLGYWNNWFEQPLFDDGMRILIQRRNTESVLLNNNVKYSERTGHIYMYNVRGGSLLDADKRSWVILLGHFDDGPLHELVTLKDTNHFIDVFGNGTYRSPRNLGDDTPHRSLEMVRMIGTGNPDICSAFRVEPTTLLRDRRMLILEKICPVHPCGREIAKIMFEEIPQPRR